ncbi:MAG: PAS domain S-box protein, partial [Anaerolineales bacterium]
NITEAGNNIKILSQSVAKFISESIGDLCLVILKNSEASQVEINAFSDTNPTGNTLMRKLTARSIRVDEEKGLVGGVIKTGEPLLIPSIHPETIRAITLPDFEEIVDKVGLVSLLIVPLRGRSGVLGAISIFRHTGGKSFKLDDQTFLMDIAHRTALAIENCRLFESLRAEIAEKLSTKQKLDTSEERFRAIFESTTLGIKVLDLDGNILQTNIAFQEMLGYSEVELLGRHFSDFLFRADLPRALNLIQNLRVSGTPQYLFEHRTVKKDETVIWVKTVFSPVRKKNGSKKLAYIVGIVENINEQKQTEQEMKELRDRLQISIENERLRLAQELHDNPIQTLHSVMYGLAELRSQADHQLTEKLDTVSSEIQAVINGLRITTKELRPPTIFDFGLENAIRSYTEDYLEKYPNISVSLSLAQDRQLLPEEMRLALFRIFQQSMMNIIRHSEATDVHVRFAFDVEKVYLEISDNGKGFDVPSNWIKFVREGHYGLAGAAERVSSLGGSLEVESNPGNTTIIKVSIPRQEAQ